MGAAARFSIPDSFHSRKHLYSRVTGNRNMTSAPLQFSTGISYFLSLHFLLLFILCFIPDSGLCTSSSSSPSASVERVKAEQWFQIVMEHDDGSPQTRQEGILHEPLTAVNAAKHLIFEDTKEAADNQKEKRRIEQEEQEKYVQKRSTKSRRKLEGFPLKTNKTSSFVSTSPPPLPTSASSPTLSASSSSSSSSPQSSVFSTSEYPTTTSSISLEYSMHTWENKASRNKRSARNEVGDSSGGGGARRSRGKGRTLETDDGEEEEKAEMTFHNHQNHHHQHHHLHHQNSLHKRAATDSPPYLLLKIFMDYDSSPANEEDRPEVGSSRGKTSRSGGPRNSTKRRRAHRSFRTSSTGRLDGDGGGNKTVENLVANISDVRHHQMKWLLKSHEENSSSFLLLAPGSKDNEQIDKGADVETRKCIPSNSSCPDGHFACKSDSALCVPQSAICNGKPDCPDGSDEDKDCVNVHEKNFWDNYFKKRPAADEDDEDAKGNGTCRYNTSWNTNEELVGGIPGSGKFGKNKGSESTSHHHQHHTFHELLATEMCRCSQEKVFCHNAHLPNLLAFPEDIEFLDLSGSEIDTLEFPVGRFHQLQTLVLSSCSIREISTETFSSLANLKDLHLTGNRLKRIPPSAFAGSANLSKLFLGHNHLEALDSESFHGLHSLEYLDLRKNRLTGEDSNVFHALGSLRTLHLNYNEIRFISKDFFTGLAKLDMLSLSKNKISTIASGAFNHTPVLRHLHLSYNRLSVLENNIFCNLQDLRNLNLNDNGITRIEPQAFECLCSLQSLILQKNPFRELTEDDRDIGSPRKLFASLISLQHIYFDEWWMCWWAPHVRSCEPKGDGISSVDNLLDNVILRVCVWIMSLVGIGGNVFVIISRLMIREKNRAHSFYIKNLAVADLLMGLFLISIAIHDLAFRGHFLAHQHAWRHSLTCQLSGMLSTLSSEASVFILFLITLDRYLSIVRPFAERTNTLIPAVLICALLWTISIFLSFAPMCPWFRGYFGRTFYTSNGLCLPLHIHNPYETGWEYSFFLFIAVNSVAFIFICYAYWKMLRIIQVSTTSIRSTQQKQDGMLVKRFGLVVASDFLCWAPIIFIKCIAMAGVEIQSNLYAYIAVFVLPVNSALNPIIYTLSTKLFKQHVHLNPLPSSSQINSTRLIVNVSHFTIGFRKRLGMATDESTTSSLLYRNRISRTMQTSLNSSMMLSTRRHGGGGGDSNNSTRVTVLRDRMAMTNRMSSKVGSYSPPTVASVGNVAPVVVTTTGLPATSPSSIMGPGKEHVFPNESENSSKNTPASPTTTNNTVAEINGQIPGIAAQQQKVDGSNKKVETAVVESEL